MAGGTTQECSETGGSTVELTATVTLVGGAELGSIDWFVNNESAGSGETITPFLALGPHTVDVVATAVTGESGNDSVSVDVVDTTAPALEVAYLNQAGQATCLRMKRWQSRHCPPDTRRYLRPGTHGRGCSSTGIRSR